MNDCLWYSIGVCDDKCTCGQYLSMNSDEGRMLTEEYSELVEETLKPLASKFAEDNGFDNWVE